MLCQANPFGLALYRGLRFRVERNMILLAEVKVTLTFGKPSEKMDVSTTLACYKKRDAIEKVIEPVCFSENCEQRDIRPRFFNKHFQIVLRNASIIPSMCELIIQLCSVPDYTRNGAESTGFVLSSSINSAEPASGRSDDKCRPLLKRSALVPYRNCAVQARPNLLAL